MYDSNGGARNATARCENSEYVATLGIEPPSMPVMTGAAVAVGQNTQMKAPCASISFMGLSARYIAHAPAIWAPNSSHIYGPTWKSEGLTRQYVMSNIMKIRYFDMKATYPM